MKRLLVLFVACSMFLNGCGISRDKVIGVLYRYGFLNEKDDNLLDGIESKHAEELNEAIAEGADLDKVPWLMRQQMSDGSFSRYPLEISLDWGNSYTTQKLLEAGAYIPEEYLGDHDSMAFQLCGYNDNAVYEAAIARGVDINQLDRNGHTIIEDTLEGRAKPCYVKLLLQRGAKVRKQTLQLAWKKGYYYIFSVLCKNDSHWKKSFSDLQWTFLQGDIKNANTQLKEAKNCTKRDVGMAFTYGDAETWSILKAKNVKITDTVVLSAIWAGNAKMIRAYAEDGGDIKQESEDVLYRRILLPEDYVDLYQYLVEKKVIRRADLDQDYHGDWYTLGFYGSDKIIQYLVEHGYDLSKEKNIANAAMGGAAVTDRKNTVERLAKYGAVPENIEDKENITGAVFSLARSNEYKALDFLLDYCKHLDTTGPLIMEDAIRYCSLESIKVLEQHGVKISKRHYQQIQEEGSKSRNIKKYVEEKYEKNIL